MPLEDAVEEVQLQGDSREVLSDEAADLIRYLEEMLEQEEIARAQHHDGADDRADTVNDDGAEDGGYRDGDEDVGYGDGGLSDEVPNDVKQRQKEKESARKEELAEFAQARERRPRGKLRRIPWGAFEIARKAVEGNDGL